MFWHHNGMGGFGYLLMLLNSLVFWGLLAAGGWIGWRALRDHRERRVGDPAERLLAERFARGEINDEEYRRRLDTLRHAWTPAPLEHLSRHARPTVCNAGQ